MRIRGIEAIVESLQKPTGMVRSLPVPFPTTISERLLPCSKEWLHEDEHVSELRVRTKYFGDSRQAVFAGLTRYFYGDVSGIVREIHAASKYGYPDTATKLAEELYEAITGEKL